MDPNACLLRMLDALARRDQDEFDAASEDLWQWLNTGGFMPDTAHAALEGAKAKARDLGFSV